jgi:two-component system, NarL family, sensor kinase
MEVNIILAGGIVLTTILVVLITVYIFFYQKRNYRQMREKDQLLSRFQKELLRTKLEIQDQTLKNISKEIHDNIGQVLSLAKLNLNTTDVSNLDATDKICSSKDLVGKAILDLRGLLRNLSSDKIENMGLYHAIENELEQIKNPDLYETQLEMEGDLPRLDAQKELILFRIVQETLHKFIQYGAAKNINVSLKNSEHDLELVITGDGMSADVGLPKENNGSGQDNSYCKMHRRAKIINVDFTLNRKTQGTEVKLVLPLNK